MSTKLLLKLAQVAGALLMAAGMAAHLMDADDYTARLFLLGGVLYGGARLTAWLRSRSD